MKHHAAQRIAAFIISFLCAATLLCAPALADPAPEETPQTTTPNTLSADIITAEGALLYDLKTGTVLFSKNPDARFYPASTTKILTALLAIEKGNLADQVTLTEDIKNLEPGSSLAGLMVGETLTLEQLLYALMLRSGNDAANAVAVHIGGSLDGFVAMMNERAQQLGMTNSHFMNAHGLHNPEHYMTAADMQKLVMTAYQNETFRKIVSTWEYTLEPNAVCTTPRVFTNGNLLLSPDASEQFRYEGANGIKTGFTNEAGQCLIASAEKDGVALGTIVFKSTKYEKWRDSIRMFYYGFNNYATLDLVSLMNTQHPQTVQVAGAASDDIAEGKLQLHFVPEEGSGILTNTKAYIQNITARAGEIQIVTDPETLEIKAPVEAGARLGTFSMQLDGEELLRGTITASRDVAPKRSLVQWSAQQETQLGKLKWIMYLVLGAFVLITILLIIQHIVRRKQRRRSHRRGGHAPLTLVRANRPPVGRTPPRRGAPPARRQPPRQAGTQMRDPRRADDGRAQPTRPKKRPQDRYR
nr:D-alanyl-D-alanine carboxypeptidase family protein [Maliibacterium massiliense]